MEPARLASAWAASIQAMASGARLSSRRNGNASSGERGSCASIDVVTTLLIEPPAALARVLVMILAGRAMLGAIAARALQA
jgi:hypothetical protein